MKIDIISQVFLLVITVLLLLLSTIDLSGQENLNTSQMHTKYIAKKVGESICTKSPQAKDMCFGKTLQAIAWQESSFGENKIGDDGTSFGSFQIRILTAKRVISDLELRRYYYLLQNDQKLVTRLINDVWFSATIAGYYLKINYEYGLKKDHWDPWVLTVSRYNGGNFNRSYLKKIVQKIKKLS